MIENYLPKTDRAFIILNVILLKHQSGENYLPAKELSINFEKDIESEQAVRMFRELADKIEQNAHT